MATAKLRLRSKANKDNTHTIVLIISQKGKQTEIATRYAVLKKDFRNERILNSCKSVGNVREVNTKLSKFLNEAWARIDELAEKRLVRGMSAVAIANYIKKGGAVKNISFSDYFEIFIEKIINGNTARIYRATANFLKKNYGHLEFTDINKRWLYDFKKLRLEQSTAATANLDLRNIRAVFNAAIYVDEYVSSELYPFRNFEFAKSQARNLRLPLGTILEIRDYKTDNKNVEVARDVFMLSFYLIGINTSDLYGLKEMKGDRVEYVRNKTGKFYDIRVEPEARKIIEKYRGSGTLLSFSSKYANPENLTKFLNKRLKVIGADLGIKGLIMYHARHSWAGIAAQAPIGAGKGLIAQALGHGKTTVTDTYFDYDVALVDKLNRNILDLLAIF